MADETKYFFLFPDWHTARSSSRDQVELLSLCTNKTTPFASVTREEEEEQWAGLIISSSILARFSRAILFGVDH
jgi:hypothetical protein